MFPKQFKNAHRCPSKCNINFPWDFIKMYSASIYGKSMAVWNQQNLNTHDVITINKTKKLLQYDSFDCHFYLLNILNTILLGRHSTHSQRPTNPFNQCYLLCAAFRWLFYRKRFNKQYRIYIFRAKNGNKRIGELVFNARTDKDWRNVSWCRQRTRSANRYFW